MNKRKISQTKGTDPKTSEFAFFKKLKKDASDGFHLRPLQKESRQSSKKSESTDYSREKMGDVRIGSNCDNSSRIIEHVSTVRADSCFSPSVKAWNKSGLYCISYTPKGSQDYSDKFKSQRIFSHEDQHAHGEVFARKRQKLRLSAADALFTDLEKLCSKGHDIISMLLSRLFPTSTEENKYEDTHPGKEANGARYDLPDSRKSDDQFKEQYRIPKTKLLGLESSPNLRDLVLSPSYLRLDGRFNLHSKFPTYDSNNFPPRITEPDCKQSATQSFGVATKGDVIPEPLLNEAANATRHGLHDSRELDVQFAEHHQIPKRKPLELESSSSFNDHFLSPVFLRSFEMINPHADFQPYPLNFQPLLSMTEARSNFGGTPSFIDKSDVTRGFLSNNQDREIFTSNHFKELGIPEKESIPLMEKDFDYTANATNFPITYMHTKPNMPPELSILGQPEEQTLHNTLDRYHFSPSFSLLDKSQNFSSILDSGFLRYQEVKFGRYVYEDMDTNFNHTALSLSHSKHYFNVQENWKNDTSCDQDMFFSPYKHWVGRTVSSAYHHHPNLETWLPSSLDECQRSLSLTSSHLNCQSSSSRTLQLSQRESVPSLFQINDNDEPEMDGENHEEVLYHFRKSLIEIYNSSFLHMSMPISFG
ncbi:uncharacterized protein HKW66_Vig0239150 [Vigna angularis]|uniref:Uncharacterized protein n=1 Tax=Phaseolus angularis TaxID=3914 RepID=A0A8T0KUP8_PHAAN|nr:uncharacterized protein LOC108323356 [Vigna angularis]KAG2402718.1 uncharacterized protein HKW66_Vig0239150 [Vigna angularis]